MVVHGLLQCADKVRLKSDRPASNVHWMLALERDSMEPKDIEGPCWIARCE